MLVVRAEWGVEGGQVPGLILLRLPHHHPHTQAAPHVLHATTAWTKPFRVGVCALYPHDGDDTTGRSQHQHDFRRQLGRAGSGRVLIGEPSP